MLFLHLKSEIQFFCLKRWFDSLEGCISWWNDWCSWGMSLFLPTYPLVLSITKAITLYSLCSEWEYMFKEILRETYNYRPDFEKQLLLDRLIGNVQLVS